MTDTARPGETFEIEPSDSGGLAFHLPWWLIAMAAVVVTELTAHPAIGVIVLCLKFGWNDCLSAFWLRHRDPDRLRGATCFWFYLASGLWRICLWSFLLLFLTIAFLVATEMQGLNGGRAQPANRQETEMLTCLLVWMLSFGMAVILTSWSIGLAWRRHVKVWITGSMTHARHLGHWPPLIKPERRNLLRFWLVATGIPLVVIGIVLWIALFANLIGLGGDIAAVMIMVLLMIIGATLVLTVGMRVFSRVGAAAPADCWPELLEVGYLSAREILLREWAPATCESNQSPPNELLLSEDHENDDDLVD